MNFQQSDKQNFFNVKNVNSLDKKALITQKEWNTYTPPHNGHEHIFILDVVWLLVVLLVRFDKFNPSDTRFICVNVIH